MEFLAWTVLVAQARENLRTPSPPPTSSPPLSRRNLRGRSLPARLPSTLFPNLPSNLPPTSPSSLLRTSPRMPRIETLIFHNHSAEFVEMTSKGNPSGFIVKRDTAVTTLPLDQLDPREPIMTYSQGPQLPQHDPGKGQNYTAVWSGSSSHKAAHSCDIEDQLQSGVSSQQKSQTTRRSKFKESLWRSSARLDKAIYKAEDNIKKVWNHETGLNDVLRRSTSPETGEESASSGEVYYGHSPPSYDHHPPGKLTGLKGTIARTLTGGRSALKFGRKPSPPGHAGHPEGDMVDDVDDVEGWLDPETVTDWEHSDYFIACTTSQLKELEGDIMEKHRVVKPYIGPPTTPDPEFADEVNSGPKEDLEPWLTDPSIMPPFIPFKEYNPDTLHKDLARHLGVRNYGIQVLSTKLPENYDLPENLSSYYGMPMIESPEQYHSNYLAESLKEDNSSLHSSASSNYDQTLNVFFPPHTQIPAQSLILYLKGRGLSLEAIAVILGPLDDKWVYNHASRWWNGFRVPEHWQFNDEMVSQIQEKMKAEMQWWEGERDQQGKLIPESLRVIKARMRVSAAERLVKKVLENYFWWRMKCGQRYHTQILCG